MKYPLAILVLPVLFFSGCSTTSTTTVPPGTTATVTTHPISSGTLTLIQTASAVTTGAVLNFAVKTSATRTRLANEIYASANFLYTASGGTLPTVSQFSSGLTAWGASSDVQYAQYTSALTAIYQLYYAKYVAGSISAANLSAILNAIAAGAESGAQAYATIPAPTTTSPSSSQ